MMLSGGKKQMQSEFSVAFFEGAEIGSKRVESCHFIGR